MPSEKQLGRVRRQIERARERAEKKDGRILSRWQVMHLKVQTASPWGRALVVIAGFGFMGLFAYMLGKHGFSWGLLLLVVPGLVLIVIGIRGRKREVEQVLNGLDSAITQNLLDGLF
jgi:hypothetical protein